MRLLNNILRVGINSATLNEQAREIMTINFANTGALVILLLLFINSFSGNYFATIVEFIFILFGVLPVYYLQRKQQYYKAKIMLFFYTTMSIVLVSLNAVLSNRAVNTEVILFAVAISSILYFNGKEKVLAFIILSSLYFSITVFKYFYWQHKELNDFVFECINLMVMFCGAFLFVNTFKLYFLDYEKKIIENNRALVLMNEEKDRLFSIIAHDLRSPLSSLNQILGMLAEGNLSKEEFDVLVSKISKNAQESSELLNNLLQWASSQMKGFKIIAAPLNIQQTLNETISNVVPIAQQKNITIINEIPEDIVANVDANMIKIVFRNLLINAIKFSNKGSEIFLEATKENNNIKVFIKDQGVGIAAKDIPLLFNSLTYTKPGTQNEKGTGLGLVLCKLFVERNNGTISVESRPRVGSTFCVTLPVA